MDGVEGSSAGTLWTPITPAKTVGKAAAAAAPSGLPLIDLNEVPDLDLELELEFPPGFEPTAQYEETREFPPGFEPKVRLASVLEPGRREDCDLGAGDAGRGEGYGPMSMQLDCSLPGFRMGPFSSLLAMDDDDGLCCGSGSGGHVLSGLCSCHDFDVEHPITSSLISRRDDGFQGACSGRDVCRGIGGLPEDRSQFPEVTPAVDAVTLEQSIPVAPGKAGGLQSRNPETKNPTTKDQVTDKGDNKGIEKKTPPKKEKKKKHRPKVVKEVKPGTTPKRKQTVSGTGAPRDDATPKRKYVKRTVSGTGAPRDDATPKRKYVKRKGTENVQTATPRGLCDSTDPGTAQSQPPKKLNPRNADREASSNPGMENSARKRKHVKRKGARNAETTPLAEVPSVSAVPATPQDNSTRKSIKRALKFESEVTTKEDGAAEITNNCPDLVSACSPFPIRKRARTTFPIPAALDRTESSSVHGERVARTNRTPSMTETVLSAQHKFEYFQHVAPMGENVAAAMAPEAMNRGSHYSLSQVHPYLELSLSNIQKDFAVDDRHYSAPVPNHSAAYFGLTGWPITGPRQACLVPFAGAAASMKSGWNSSWWFKDRADQLKKLNTNQKIGGVPLVTSDDLAGQRDNAVVLFEPAGTIVPYGIQSYEPKKRKQRAKVVIDEETNRVWQLLLKGIDDERVDGTEEETVKWWEEERAVFRRRAESFIARMRLVQGDRRFSPWKGSVVDSVVGVFLTQNVSDILSSSTFMSLASRYPLKKSQDSIIEEASVPETKNEMGCSFMERLNGGLHSDKCSPTLNEESRHDSMNENIPTGKPDSKEKKEENFDWDSLRKETEARGSKREKTPDNSDSVDWESVRSKPAEEIASVIEKRGMHQRLAERIKEFLDRVVRDHGRLDLEWLRDIPPDKAKDYLLSFTGLGPKSVDCVRLLSLHHVAFPVDINVGRIAVRLGWVPLQPLPETLDLHLLEMYPILESVQTYLWPRLCKLDQGTLYELHYQMITFGKVFCTKNKPNCSACPMRAECRHYASAYASLSHGLPAPEQTARDDATEETTATVNLLELFPLPLQEKLEILDVEDLAGRYKQRSCRPIIEEPDKPEQGCKAVLGNDLEEWVNDFEDDEEIPTINLKQEDFNHNSQQDMDIQEDEMSKALVALPPGAASVPAAPLKSRNRLRTEHLVYEIPQGHPLLDGLDKLDPDDPSKYLLAIWTPGETATSIQQPEGGCGGCASKEGQLCKEPCCVTCCSIREADSQIVRGTILIPCRTAMRGSFPLNGTYFQVFADHETSLNPLNVQRSLIWNLPRRTVYCGPSISAIFRGMSMEAIRRCFWRGYVCVRGFDRKTRNPCPLSNRIHVLASTKAKADAEAKAKAKTGEKAMAGASKKAETRAKAGTKAGKAEGKI